MLRLHKPGRIHREPKALVDLPPTEEKISAFPMPKSGGHGGTSFAFIKHDKLILPASIGRPKQGDRFKLKANVGCLVSSRPA